MSRESQDSKIITFHLRKSLAERVTADCETLGATQTDYLNMAATVLDAVLHGEYELVRPDGVIAGVVLRTKNGPVELGPEAL